MNRMTTIARCKINLEIIAQRLDVCQGRDIVEIALLLHSKQPSVRGRDRDPLHDVLRFNDRDSGRDYWYWKDKLEGAVGAALEEGNRAAQTVR
jgi:hypothetical protein